MVFVEELASYTSDVDPYKFAREQLLTYIEKTYNIDGEEANAIYKEMLKDREVRDPQVSLIKREKGLDTKETSMSLLNYIEEHKLKNEAMTPSFTCYDREEKSYQGMFIEDGLSNRSSKKKEAAICEGKGDALGFLINNLLQKAFKLRNNSLSGAYLSLSTIFYNPSSHTALTSGTRLAASLANMVTESMVAGKRLYSDPETVINHFLSIITSIDKSKIEATNAKYDIVYPTTQDILNMVTHSIRDYWRNEKYFKHIEDFVSTLDKFERSAILYTYDLYHLEKASPDFARGMLDKLSRQHIGLSKDLAVLDTIDEFILNITHHICFSSLKGEGKDYSKFPTRTKDLVVSTAIMLDKNVKYYTDYIDTYLKSEVMPINIAFIKDMIMEAVSHSDTDSTCGWYGDRVYDRFGKYDMTTRGVGYFSAYMMFNSGVVSHLLRQLTANFNVAVDKRDKLAMKNEFYFPVFGSANVTKHYIANILIKEGLVYDTPKLEVKGNSLIASNNDKFIREDFTDLVTYVTNILTTGAKLDVDVVLGKVIALEREVTTRLERGDPSVFKLDNINTTYKVMKGNPDNWQGTNLYHSKLYDAVFKDKYGASDDLPYIGVNIPLKSGNLLEMLEEIEDEDIKKRFIEFMEKYPKPKLERLIYPINIISSTGLPKELKHIVDAHKLITLLLKGHYVLLEILGIYIKPDTILTEQGY